jgi:peptide/nickel transport system ATP-binding protein
MTAILEANGIVKKFRGRGRSLDVLALDGVDFYANPGEIVGIVGESGSGKSTLSRILVGIESSTEGAIFHNGKGVTSSSDWKELRSEVQYIFQDPFLSLAPHMTIGQSIGDGLEIRGEGTPQERANRVSESLEMVGLKGSDASSYPSAFSGGQRQRISLARALVLRPRLIICDEIVSGLDVSIQAQILNLLIELRNQRDVSMIFVSHDLRVIKYFCERIVVMHGGIIVETNSSENLFAHPQHEYTQHLLNCVPASSLLMGT